MPFAHQARSPLGLDFEAPILPSPVLMEVSPARSSSAWDGDVHLVETAHRAVEATLHAADLLARPGHPAVKLEINVGGEHLVVRVESQAGEIRTVFQTDSPDLQAALAHEWHLLVGPGGERPIRLAEPEFAGLGGAPSGDTSDARDHGRRPAEDGRAMDDDFPAEPEALSVGEHPDDSPVSRAEAGTALHLHTRA